jgi:hypothetical protein
MKKTTADFLDALRVHFDAPSDNALRPHTKWHRQQISRYRTLKSTFDATTGKKVAEWLGLDPSYVAACMSAQRAKHAEVRDAWERVAKRLAAGAIVAFVLVALGLGALPEPSQAGQFASTLLSRGVGSLFTRAANRTRWPSWPAAARRGALPGGA